MEREVKSGKDIIGDKQERKQQTSPNIEHAADFPVTPALQFTTILFIPTWWAGFL